MADANSRGFSVQPIPPDVAVSHLNQPVPFLDQAARLGRHSRRFERGARRGNDEVGKFYDEATPWERRHPTILDYG